MTFDPNSPIARAPEVRVTMRGVRLTDGGTPVQVSTRSDFIAPDYAPASTHETEMDKGLAGWSDGPTPESVTPVFTDWAKRDLAALTVGTAIATRKASNPVRVMNRQGPGTVKRSKWC